MTSSRPADVAGAGLALLLAGAAVLSALHNDAGSAWPICVTLAGTGCSYVAGRVLAPALPLVAGFVLATTALVVLLNPAALSGGPHVPPLGYANANAALYVQLAGLAAVAAVTASDVAWRTSATLVVAVLVVLTGLTGSLAGFTGALAVLAVLGAAVAGRSLGRIVLISALAAVLAAHLTVIALGTTYRSDDGSPAAAHSAAASGLSDRRLLLWSDAVTIAARHPLTGTGPRTFPVTSSTALRDPDTRQAHSATLQMAAETGWPGAAALLGLLLWAVARPTLTDRRTTGAGLVTTTSLAALAVHASVDYVLASPVVVLAAALVLGTGTGVAAGAIRWARAEGTAPQGG